MHTNHINKENNMRKPNMKTATKRYNNIMFDIAREHNTIGTSFSENTEKWNLRDMVSEMQYTLDLWNDETSLAWEDAHDGSQPAWKPWYREWQNEKARMKRFIDAYSPHIDDMVCAIGHCSCYD